MKGIWSSWGPYMRRSLDTRTHTQTHVGTRAASEPGREASGEANPADTWALDPGSPGPERCISVAECPGLWYFVRAALANNPETRPMSTLDEWTLGPGGQLGFLGSPTLPKGPESTSSVLAALRRSAKSRAKSCRRNKPNRRPVHVQWKCLHCQILGLYRGNRRALFALFPTNISPRTICSPFGNTGQLWPTHPFTLTTLVLSRRPRGTPEHPRAPLLGCPTRALGGSSSADCPAAFRSRHTPPLLPRL